MKYLGKKKVLDENFAGKRFVLTGTLKELTRDVAKDYIVTRGGKCIESVSSKTDVVIVGEIQVVNMIKLNYLVFLFGVNKIS